MSIKVSPQYNTQSYYVSTIKQSSVRQATAYYSEQVKVFKRLDN